MLRSLRQLSWLLCSTEACQHGKQCSRPLDPTAFVAGPQLVASKRRFTCNMRTGSTAMLDMGQGYGAFTEQCSDTR